MQWGWKSTYSVTWWNWIFDDPADKCFLRAFGGRLQHLLALSLFSQQVAFSPYRDFNLKKINSLSIHVFSEQGSIPREKLHLVHYVYIMCTCDKCRYIFSVAPSSQNLRIRHYQCSTEMLTVESRYFWCCGTKIWRVICTVLTNVSTDEKKS